ncbi:MAG: SHOCT domain-containing protein [Acidimicrobiia bacterium]
MLAAVGLGELLWTCLVLFLMVVWLIILFQVLIDLFRSHDIGGFAKTLWVIALFVATPFAVLAYLLVRGGGMAKRQAEQAAQAQKEFANYVQTVAGASGPADQIAQAKAMLDTGAITQAEYEQLKAKALA